jgi:hypothetical protein
LIFCPNGWVSIGGFAHKFTSAITFWKDGPLSDQDWAEADQQGLFTAWDCLEAMPKAAILGPTGEVIPIDVGKLASAGWIGQKTNEHINIDYGTLGSGHGGILADSGYIDAPMPSETAKLRYGPFAYCPILIPKVAFDLFDAKNDAELRQENGHLQPRKGESSTVEKIFKTIDSGRAARRDDIKRIVAIDMKVDEWRAHWREAVAIRPELGKSGPKKKLD